MRNHEIVFTDGYRGDFNGRVDLLCGANNHCAGPVRGYFIMKTMMKNDDAVTGELIPRDHRRSLSVTAVATFVPWHSAHVSESPAIEYTARGLSIITLCASVALLAMALNYFGVTRSLQPFLWSSETQIALERERLAHERQTRLDEYRHAETMALITSNQTVQVARAQSSAVAASAKWFDGVGVGAAAIVVLVIVLLALVAILS